MIDKYIDSLTQIKIKITKYYFFFYSKNVYLSELKIDLALVKNKSNYLPSLMVKLY